MNQKVKLSDLKEDVTIVFKCEKHSEIHHFEDREELIDLIKDPNFHKGNKYYVGEVNYKPITMEDVINFLIEKSSSYLLSKDAAKETLENLEDEFEDLLKEVNDILAYNAKAKITGPEVDVES